MKIYFYPLHLKSKASNPYSHNFVASLQQSGVSIVNHKNGCKVPFVDMLINCKDPDMYIFNWIEEIASGRAKYIGFLPFLLFYIFFNIQRLRGKKFIWVYHNIVSHHNETIYSKKIKTMMLKYSYLIITFSKEALNILQPQTDKKVLFYNHPINDDLLTIEPTVNNHVSDILIWGGISRYKGIVEFLQFLYDTNRENVYNIYIVGKCSNMQYDLHLKSFMNDHITYENKHIEFTELKALVSNSKYVLFPYIGDSISSSGALIDTIIFNGTAIGPHKGAFKDLAEDNVCLTYQSYEDIIEILTSNVKVKQCARYNFINNNSWKSFGSSIVKKIQQ